MHENSIISNDIIFEAFKNNREALDWAKKKLNPLVFYLIKGNALDARRCGFYVACIDFLTALERTVNSDDVYKVYGEFTGLKGSSFGTARRRVSVSGRIELELNIRYFECGYNELWLLMAPHRLKGLNRCEMVRKLYDNAVWAGYLQ